MNSPESYRTRMAMRLANTLRRYPGGEDPHVVIHLSDVGWAQVAEVADCRPGYVPSAATRDVVVAILQARLDEDGAVLRALGAAAPTAADIAEGNALLESM